MTSEGNALFRAVCEHPADDTPRLVYADWLEENGQPARAEFVRLQCEAWNQCPEYPTIEAARTRASQLYKQFGQRWDNELPMVVGVAWGDLYIRGFIDTAWLRPGPKTEWQIHTIFAATPLQYLVVSESSPAALRAILKCDCIGRLTTLDVAKYNEETVKLCEAIQQRFPHVRI